MTPAKVAPRRTVLRRSKGFLSLNLKQLWEYRDLLVLFVRRDVKVRYSQTVLGPAWLVIQPLAMTGILTTMVSGVVGASTGGAEPSLFYLTTILAWGYFSQVVTLVGNVFIANEYLFKKIYFPRIVRPIADVISNVVGLGIQLALLAAFLLIYYVTGHYAGMSVNLLLAPLVIVQLMVFSLGVGLIVASSTARYRDLVNALQFMLQAWFFLTPVVYPLSTVPEAYRPLIAFINPLAIICDRWRFSILGFGSASYFEIALSIVSSLLVLLIGVALYQRAARNVADTL
jgi:lipopolysaccharide transport system permease protein